MLIPKKELLIELQQRLNELDRPFPLEVLDKVTKIHDNKILDLIKSGTVKEINVKFLGKFKLKNYKSRDEVNNDRERDACDESRTEDGEGVQGDNLQS